MIQIMYFKIALTVYLLWNLVATTKGWSIPSVPKMAVISWAATELLLLAWTWSELIQEALK